MVGYGYYQFDECILGEQIPDGADRNNTIILEYVHQDEKKDEWLVTESYPLQITESETNQDSFIFHFVEKVPFKSSQPK